MKFTFIFAAAALACGVAFAQSTPAVQAGTNAVGKAEKAAEAKVDARKDAGSTATMAKPAGVQAQTNATGKAEKAAEAKVDARKDAAMDANGDGMISRKEWDAYHTNMWRGMKADKKGMVAWADVEAKMSRGTPK